MKLKTIILAMLAGAVIWTAILVTVVQFIPDTPPLPAGPVPATRTTLRT